jgi:hypothetical protein
MYIYMYIYVYTYIYIDNFEQKGFLFDDIYKEDRQ